MRGTQVRNVKDHIRCEVVLTKGRYKLIQYVEAGRRYSSEIKMLQNILQKIELRGKKFLADRLYDVLWLRDYLKEKGIKAVIRVRRNGVGREEVVYFFTSFTSLFALVLACVSIITHLSHGFLKQPLPLLGLFQK